MRKCKRIILLFTILIVVLSCTAHAEPPIAFAQLTGNAVEVNITLENEPGIVCAALIAGDTTVAVATSKVEKELKIKFPDGKVGDTVKIFLWESITSLKPVCNVSIAGVSKNPFYGKKLYVDGDSICYGNGYKGGFGKILADKYDMELINAAVGGATISVGATDVVKYGTELDWANTQYYLKLPGFAPIENKDSDGFAIAITKEIYENGYGVYPTAYKVVNGELVQQEYSETMPKSTFFVKFDMPTYDGNTVPKYYRMWSTNNWLWEAYKSGFKSAHEEQKTIIGTARHWISNSVEAIANDADFIILEGGINDYLMNRQIGKITESKTEAVDTTTVIGGMEHICRTLLKKGAEKKALYVVTPKAREYTTKPNNNTAGAKTWQDYHDAIITVLEKYGINYVDLFETEFDTAKEEYLQYTINRDGVHPTKEGYEKFYIPYIEKAMRK